MKVTAPQLVAIAGREVANAEALAAAYNANLLAYGINTKLRLAFLLSQIAHETGGFRWFRELGTDAYFARYDGRLDLGNTEPGDGPRFKGRGGLHHTGRANYAHLQAVLSVPLLEEPSLLELPEHFVRADLDYWSRKKINQLADKDDAVGVTRKVNGGLNGYSDRLKYLLRARKVLGLPL